MSTEPIFTAAADPTTGVELDATICQHGGGMVQHGIQITATKNLTVLVARLSKDEAVALAQAILTSYSDNTFMTPAEVAKFFRVDTKTVSRWAAAGRLPSARTIGGHRRYRMEDVVAALTKGAGVER